VTVIASGGGCHPPPRLLPHDFGQVMLARKHFADPLGIVAAGAEVGEDSRSPRVIVFDFPGFLTYLFGIYQKGCPMETAKVVPARIIWTRFCNSSRLSQSIGLTGFEG
jgi:hypothetical protein